MALNGAEAVLAPSPDMRRVRTSWLGTDGRPRASRPAAAAKASAGERARLERERRRLQAELTGLRAELELELLRAEPMTVEQWVARWFSDPLRAAAARRMIWCFDEVPALPTPDGVRDVEGEPVQLAAVEFVALWHPAEWTSELVSAWQERLGALGIVQPVEQAAREVVGVGRFFGLCDEIGWLDQTRMRAFLHGRGWKVPWLGRFDYVPYAHTPAVPRRTDRAALARLQRARRPRQPGDGDLRVGDRGDDQGQSDGKRRLDQRGRPRHPRRGQRRPPMSAHPTLHRDRARDRVSA